jgi:hypothetical protein
MRDIVAGAAGRRASVLVEAATFASAAYEVTSNATRPGLDRRLAGGPLDRARDDLLARSVSDLDAIGAAVRAEIDEAVGWALGRASSAARWPTSSSGPGVGCRDPAARKRRAIRMSRAVRAALQLAGRRPRVSSRESTSRQAATSSA